MTSNTPRIETSRLILRKFTEEDAPALFNILKDEAANTFLPWFVFETLPQAREFLHNRFLAYYHLPLAYRYAICLKSDDIPVGYVNISDGASHDFGYALRTELWHRGIVSEACMALTGHLRGSGYSYITATHDIQNPRSGAVMKKIGMIYRYSYEERVQPKNQLVTFRMYQLNFTEPEDFIYMEYWNNYPVHFIEQGL